MKYKVTIGLLILIILVIAGAFCKLYIDFKKTKKINDRSQKTLVNKAEILKAEKELFQVNLFQNYAQSKLEFDKTVKCNTNNVTKESFETLFSSPKVVLRFSNNDCMDCVFRTLPYVDSLAKYVGYDNIIVMAQGYELNGLISFGESNDIKAKMIEEPEGIFDGTNIGSPFFFTIDKSMIASHFFTPDKFFMQHTISYFKIMQKNIAKK